MMRPLERGQRDLGLESRQITATVCAAAATSDRSEEFDDFRYFPHAGISGRGKDDCPGRTIHPGHGLRNVYRK